MVENGGVTHPKIAQMIGEAYGLEEDDIYELMPRIHRPDDEKYDPDHYKPLDDGKRSGMKTASNPIDEYYIYVSDNYRRKKRNK